MCVCAISRPYVYAVHSEQPDTFGHRLGPLSSEVSSSLIGWKKLHVMCLHTDHTCLAVVVVQLDNPLREIDNIIGQLMNGLKQMDLHRCVNIIIVGDHGRSNTGIAQGPQQLDEVINMRHTHTPAVPPCLAVIGIF